MSKSAKNAEYHVFDFKKQRIFNMNLQNSHLREPTSAYINRISTEIYLTFYQKKLNIRLKTPFWRFQHYSVVVIMIQNTLLTQV